MNTQDRQMIEKNLLMLKDNINLSELIPHLKSEGLFSDLMLQDYMLRTKPEEKRKEKLILDVRKRGANGLERFVKCLISAKQHRAAVVLKPDLNNHGICSDISEPNSTYPIKKIFIKKASSPTLQLPNMYEVTSKPKGLALIIVNEEFTDSSLRRQGAKNDYELWKDLFMGLNYEIIHYMNQSREEMENSLEEFTENANHAKYHSCIVAISSHGKENNIVCSDGNEYPVNYIFEIFNNHNCPGLKEKPKLFFIQACRGGKLDNKIQSDDISFASVETNLRKRTSLKSNLPAYTDMIIAYSSIDGFISYRDVEHGSWFVQVMCQVLMNNACDTHLDEMLKIIQQEMCRLQPASDCKQMCEITCKGWRRYFYFNPGF